MGLAFSSALLLGCASALQSPPGADSVRDKLARLQSDPVLSNAAPESLERAEVAVRLAEQPLGDSAEDQALGAHRVYLADRQVEIAMAQASTRQAEDQRAQFAEQRSAARLDARTLEANRAQAAAERAAVEAAELKRQIESLKAEATDRGLVLTLGDLLFAFDSAELEAGLSSNLDRLVTLLKKYPTRNAVIEGHTDNIGNAEYNRDLSLRRAEAVRRYLVGQGIGSDRLSAAGLGQTQPLAGNSSDSGRQRNRRVEIIIDNPAPASVSQRMQ